jgi:hypothetical protein
MPPARGNLVTLHSRFEGFLYSYIQEMKEPIILYVDKPMINRTGLTENQSTIIYNCNIINPNILSEMSEHMENLAVSNFSAAGRFFCITSIDAINQIREMIVIELGNTEQDLNVLLDFMSQGDTKGSQDQRIKATKCFHEDYAPNYKNKYYDFEVRAGSPT